MQPPAVRIGIATDTITAPDSTGTELMALLDWLEEPPDPPDPPRFDEPDDDPPDTWDSHPSLTPEQRNSRCKCQ